MKFVTRAQWGAVPPRSDWVYVASNVGVKIHYEGSPVSLALASDHGLCASHVRAIQASHMADTDQGWTDIAYSAMVCHHGYVFEGRGAHHKTGANGNSALNAAHYAVCGMVGDSGLTEPSTAMLHGLRDAVEWLRRDGGAGAEIKGHRDGYATSCPGGPLYAWVQAGAPRPSTQTNPEETDMLASEIGPAPIYYLGPDGKQPPVLSNVGDFLNSFTQAFARIEAAVAAQTVVINALVAQLGQAHGVDTVAVLAAINAALAKAEIGVNVHVKP